jgi:diadenosine tetraphosphate (Ap4A) HIT family hydrolase
MVETARPPYDDSNIFARILRGEIPCKKIYEDDFALAFYDIQPHAPVHALVIPKGQYTSFADFGANATPEEITGLTRAVALVARQLGVEDTGYRVITNTGPHSHQSVGHFHVHILGGRSLGMMLVGAPVA